MDEEPDQAIILVGARGNLSATQIRDVVAQVEDRVMTVKGVENVVMTATAPGGSSGVRRWRVVLPCRTNRPMWSAKFRSS